MLPFVQWEIRPRRRQSEARHTFERKYLVMSVACFLRRSIPLKALDGHVVLKLQSLGHKTQVHQSSSHSPGLFWRASGEGEQGKAAMKGPTLNRYSCYAELMADIIVVNFRECNAILIIRAEISPGSWRDCAREGVVASESAVRQD